MNEIGSAGSEQTLQRAMAAHRAGNLVEAERLYRAILEANSNHPVALHLLGVIEHQRGHPKYALSLIDKALAIKPDYVEALINRGNVFSSMGHSQQALDSYDQALLINASDHEALCNRGIVLYALGRFSEALASYDRALEVRPDSPYILNNRGNTLRSLNLLQPAIDSYNRALAIRPDFPAALNNLSSALVGLDRISEALENYDRALAIKPDYPDALYNRGNALRKMGQWEAARESYDRALQVQPNYADARFARTMAELPILYRDEAEIEKCRAAYEERLKAQCNDVEHSGAAGDLASGVGSHQPFYLAYQGRNNRALQARYGSLVCQIMAARYSPAPLAEPPAPSEPLRVGVVTGFFRRHSVWKLNVKGWFSQLDRRRFRVFGYHTSSQQDDETAIAAANCDRFVQGPLSIDQWRRIIIGDAPNILIYPEVGMEQVSAALAAQRLAPVQCNSWGHPDTSGFPTLDYYLSSDLMEPADGQEHYTERLVTLPNLSVCYEPFAVPPMVLSRADFGLRAAGVTFWCGQTLHKYLPQFDWVFAEIARRMPDCQFVFIQHQRGAYITELFRQRLELAFAALGLRFSDHCVFLPRLDFPRFVASFGLCDVVLDSIGWSGANTTLESLQFDLPIVTMGAPLMRGRHTMAILKMMNVMETIAETPEHYVSIAIRLARDETWRAQVKARMSANKNRVYRDRACITAFEDFLDRVGRRQDVLASSG